MTIILFFVSVPVLSVQMTLTEPKVSTTDKLLQRTLCFFMAFAVMVRQVVKAMGKPSGMKATATLTQSTMSVCTLIQSGYSLRIHAALEMLAKSFCEKESKTYQTAMTAIIKTMTIATTIKTKRIISH